MPGKSPITAFKLGFIFVLYCHTKGVLLSGFSQVLVIAACGCLLRMKPVIVVQGGAGRIMPERKKAYLLGVKQAALSGSKKLQQGGSVVDAVEEAVVVMENDPIFNAGCGSVLNEHGEVEMDAIIMDGKYLETGAVSAVRNIANPVKLARLVMEKTGHVLLTDRGASQFAKAMNIPEVPGESLITEKAILRWKKNKKPVDCEQALGTVGAVAVDSEGNVACATSSGGKTNKMLGRVGDTPCIGSGGYADNFSGAVSTTGNGETIMKVTLARLVLFHIEQGKSPREAAETALKYMLDRIQSKAGLIVVNNSGDYAAVFTTDHMSWAAVKDDQLHYGLSQGELHTCSISDVPL
ncbi:isoaspartyl peptidase/L-asparaginase [Protopterus annectens]|uniref:isoaspartyl peptidase/L-asparaginase n=1 Tax=Protopterus annectens TaxID=7888 RepID=UPI001CFAE2E2|nr:isoaspartyl peptidase/L-asparaginase [Protopterus annectens]